MKKYLCLCILLFLLGCAQKEKKYAFLFIGDGMGYASEQAASIILTGQKDNLTFNKFPVQKFVATWSIDTYNNNASRLGVPEYIFYNIDYSVGYPYNELGAVSAWASAADRDALLSAQIFTDSAASATAMATGAKTQNGHISYDDKSGNIFNVLDRIKNNAALKNNTLTAIITTDSLYGATPAAFSAHNVSRSNKREIFEEILGVTKPDVVVGSSEWGDIENFGYENTDFNTAYKEGLKLYAPVENLGGIIKKFITYALSSGKNVFAVIEQAGADVGGHGNDFKYSVTSVEDLNNAVTILCGIIDAGNTPLNWNNTLVIVTADHETGGLRVDGQLQEGVFPLQEYDGGKNVYPNGEVKYLTTSHTADLVRFYAKGGGIEKIIKSVPDKYANTGIIDNTDIYQYVRKFLNL